MPSTSRRGPLRALSVVVFAVLAGATVAMSLTVSSVVRDHERELLTERTNEAGLLLTTFFSGAQTTLPLIAATTDPKPGSTERFEAAAAAIRSGVGTIGALSVVDGKMTLLAVASDDPSSHAEVSPAREALARRALAADGMVTAVLEDHSARELAFAVAIGDDRVLYQDLPLGPFDSYEATSGGPFGSVVGVLYAAETEDPSKRVISSAGDRPLTGDVERQQLTIGEDTWLLVTKSNGPLVDSFASYADWIVLVAGLVATLLTTVLVETLGRRRAYAMALVDERTTALRAALDERERLEESQRQAREQAETANRAKSEFISRMSHELRTPLNAVLGFGQLLELDDLTSEQSESVEQIVKGGRHLLGLINEILDISRIESGTLALSPEPVQVEELVTEVLTLLRPLADHRDIDLSYRPATDGDVHVLADRQRLKQIVLNLVANAVKYNVDGGSVTLTCDRVGDRVRIVVADTGQGIDGDDLDKLFVPFERLGAEKSAVEGAGIGLALSLRLAEAMQGTISVESSVGAGSRFSVELPVTEGQLERFARLAEADAAVGAGATTPVAGRRHTLLYIEDNLSNVRLVERILDRRNDVELIPAMQGSLGLALAREHRPSVILLDLHLPDMNGDEVLRQLRLDPVLASTPVVMVSADATAGQIDRLLAEGATAYLTKPIDVHELLALLDDTLDGVPA